MNIAIDIGNTRIKYGIFLPGGEIKVYFLLIPPRKELFNKLTAACPAPATWWIAQTGGFAWQELKAEILKVRPHDKFKIITRRQIPLKVDVHSPAKVGIDRLLAAFAAVNNFGDVPMLIVDAGTAITLDIVQNGTFCGGAILPGLVVQSEIYPKISKKLPLVSMSDLFSKTRPTYPGKNTQDAILNGIHWGTIGAIRQFYEMAFPKKNALLVSTGGDTVYLSQGLAQVIPSRRFKCDGNLVLKGISGCFER